MVCSNFEQRENGEESIYLFLQLCAGGLNLYCTGSVLLQFASLLVGFFQQVMVIFAVAYVFILALMLLEATRSFERYFYEQKKDTKMVTLVIKIPKSKTCNHVAAIIITHYDITFTGSVFLQVTYPAVFID